MLDVRYSHLYFYQSLNRLQRGLSAIAELLVFILWAHSFSTRLTSVTFAEDKVLIFLILRKNAKIVQL